jgi:hypothetical protein
MGNEKLKVLYIAGWGRSGSTILGNLLGQIEGFLQVGEIRYIWDRGLIENNLCSCGVSFRECPFWRAILSEAFGNIDGVDAERMAGFLEHGLRTKQFLLPPPWRRLDRRLADMREYSEALARLYDAANSVTRSRVIVDTSKVPAYGYVLGNLENIELYVLHLVRDPRATAYSWYSRRKLEPNSSGQVKPMLPLGFVYSSLVWNEWNLLIEGLWNRSPEQYMRLRYEDFVEHPKSAVQTILWFLGEEGSRVPFTGERKIALDSGHVFSGNPNRFNGGGTVTIKADEEWRQELSTARRAAITSITWPGLLRYRYPVFMDGGK